MHPTFYVICDGVGRFLQKNDYWFANITTARVFAVATDAIAHLHSTTRKNVRVIEMRTVYIKNPVSTER